MIPGWYAFLLLALAAWRTFQLIADDDILDRPRAWALRYGDWRPGDPVSRLGENYREKWGIFITCPYCAGFWIAVAWYLAFLVSDWTLYVATPFALSAGVVAAAKVLSRDE